MIIDGAYREGHEAFTLSLAINPYRRAMASICDADSRATLEAMAKRWDDGFADASKTTRAIAVHEATHHEL